MTRNIGLLRPLLLVALFGIAEPTPAVAQRTGTPAARVDELMAPYSTGGQPGGVIAVVERGEVIFAKGYGLANLEHGVPMTSETVLDIGSVAKQFTAFAIVLLAQDGKLSFDEDIRTYLPAVPDFGPTITVRHLVHHVSGLREIYNSRALEGWQAGDGMSQGDALRLTARMRELNFEPGTEHLYCNTGYMLVADIVAEVSGMSFPDFMEERVFGPLGMTHTTIMSRLGQSIPGSAESYGRTEEGDFVRIFDNSALFGAGGIYTTAGDLARWMANFGTAAVGGPAALEQMQERGVLANGDTLVYAFGITVTERRGLRVLAHTGSSAGYRASFTYFPELDAGVITMSNLAQFDGSIAGDVAEAFFGDRMGPRPEPQTRQEEREDQREAWKPTAVELATLAGRYFSPELQTMYTLAVEGARLIAKHRRHADFDFEPVEEDSFSGESFFGTADFQRDGSGAVTGMRVSNGRVRNMWFEKLPG
ncbi:MAG: serine hydrolase [Gemmatimonadetes bacterium]|nr:serine hydrolase [Gemmatimonadota bacterium]MDA1104412.1 serine hydrolase [Gemmatimonadota bacterium]